MPLESVAEWRARIGSSWCAVGRPFKSKSSRSRKPHRVLSQDQVETMMMLLSISFIRWLLFDLPGGFLILHVCELYIMWWNSLFVVLCLLDWQSVPNLLWTKTSGRFTFISGKNIFKRRTIVLIRRKVVITMLESTLSVTSNLIGTLLLMSGDVELNPGPGKCWSTYTIFFAVWQSTYIKFRIIVIICGQALWFISNWLSPGLNYDNVDSTHTLGMWHNNLSVL